ncbi:hypothetical protein LCGC14_0924710 [marine sediment metagenome]|uniref:Uncharacterized protein n=1 Tax=marine sediment metagenome TaxID=412755 RepID=A0A0F9R8H2_9ZZZZ
MSRFQELVLNFSIVAIMVLSLFSFFIIVQEQNDAVDPLKNNAVFSDSFEQLIGTIENNTRDAEEKYGVFNDEDPKAGVGSIVLFGIVSVGKTFSSIIFGTFIAVIKLPLVILGIAPSVYNLILVILIISVIVSVWLLYKLGG